MVETEPQPSTGASPSGNSSSSRPGLFMQAAVANEFVSVS